MSQRVRTVEPVSVEQLIKPVLVRNVDSWVTKLCKRYTTDPNWKTYFWEKRGLTKDIQDELIPLGLFCRQMTRQYLDASLHYFHGSNQSFDAKIVLASGKEAETLEVTLACDGYQEAIVAESLALYGYAPLYSNIPHSGSRGARQLPKPELVSLDADVMIKECINQVRSAVEQKSRSGKYVNTNLVVAFDDFRLLSTEHFEQVTNKFGAIESSFPVVYYVGLTGRIFHIQQA
jgi:hypothetical protein